jgi:hypothetical protein
MRNDLNPQVRSFGAFRTSSVKVRAAAGDYLLPPQLSGRRFIPAWPVKLNKRLFARHVKQLL